MARIRQCDEDTDERTGKRQDAQRGFQVRGEICFAASNQSKFNRFEGGKVFSTLFGKSTMFQALAKKISPKDSRKKKENELDLHLKAGKTSMYYVSVLLSN